MQNNQKHNFSSEIFKAILNQLNTNIFVSDMETDEIVYMNDYMKKTFHVDDFSKAACWEVLQSGQKGRCEFCKKEELQNENEIRVWTGLNSLDNRIYKNYDRMFECDGRRYHMQHSVDITEQEHLSEEARMDELTGLFNRRAGKEMLWRMIRSAKEENVKLSVVLYDVNELKAVNDEFGHGEGDHLLCYIAEAVKMGLRERDLCFRLSGDEFVIAFYDESETAAEQRMNEMLSWLEREKTDHNVSYESSFSFGVVEVYPRDKSKLTDIIARADEKMYIQKRNYHIKKARRNLEKEGEGESKLQFLYDKEHLLDALKVSTDDYIFVGNLKTGTFEYSPSMVKEFGLPGEVLENAAAFWGKLIHPHDEKSFLESNQEIADGRAESHHIEYRAKNVRGEWIWLRCRGHMIRDSRGEPELFAGFITNLGKRDQVDHVTGLYGRFSFEGDIKKYVMEDQSIQKMGIMALDMDSFKDINDLYNRSFGDDILRITARKIEAILPHNAKIYRLDGDEFGIIILNGEEEEYEEIYDSIHRLFQNQQEYNGRKYFCTISAGYASYPADADNYLDLVKCANYSLEHSKACGKNRSTRFSQDILLEKEKKLELMELLRESIDRNFTGFYVCYQPQVNAETGELLGAEALARWQCSKFGEVSPTVFIPLLEQSGMISQLGIWICERAAEKCKEWSRKKPDFHMSINLSYRQLQEGDFVNDVRKVLKRLDLDTKYITLELTETYLTKADLEVRERIDQLRDMGIALAMDDFGIGYSSLYSLKTMPVDVVKIDRGFVKDISTDLFNATFIRAITELCHKVGRRVCLEGIENEEEYGTVSGIGLDMIQGFYFGYPETEQDFVNRWMK